MFRHTIEEHILNLTYTLSFWVYREIKDILRLRRIGVRVMIMQGDQVVLVKHRSGVHPWGLPGGAVGTREPIDYAAQREAYEETGCTVHIDHMFGIFYDAPRRVWRQHVSPSSHPSHQKQSPRNTHHYLIVFVCTPLTDIHPPKRDLEIADVRFVPLQSLPVHTDMFSRFCIATYLCSRAKGERLHILAPLSGERGSSNT